MRFKLATLMGCILLASFPIASSAKTMVTIINNTDNYGTGSVKVVCSAMAGDQGIVHPHETKTVDMSGLSLLCQDNDCEGHVFLSKDCSGKQVAKVILNANKGILSIVNYDKAHYRATLNDNVVTIDPV